MTPSPRQVRYLLAIITGVSLALLATIVATQIQNLPVRDGYVMKNGELLGGDFIAFYTAGRLYDLHPNQLYDLQFQRTFRTDLLGAASPALKGELPFVYPPLVAVVMSFLSPLQFWLAFAIAAGIAALAGTLITYRVSDIVGYRSRLHKWLIVLALWGFVPFSVNTVLGGQLVWIGMLALGGVVWGLQTQRPLIAGLAMSLSYYKPPLFLLALVVLVLTEGRRFIGGFALGALVLMSLTLLTVGLSGLVEFLTVVSRYTYGQELLEGVELPPGSGAGVYGLLTTLAGGNGRVATILLGGLFAVAVGVLVHTRRRQAPEDPGFEALWLAVLWIASVGLSLQAIRYDLALVFIPLVLLVRSWWRFTGPGKLLLAVSVLGFYLEFVARKTVVSGYTLNLSSALFLVLLPTCLLTLVHQSRSHLLER